MNIILLGAAGFIGTNLVKKLLEGGTDTLTLVDRSKTFFESIRCMELKNTVIREARLGNETDYDSLLAGQDIVYHLISTTVPSTSNQFIPEGLMENVVVTSRILDACVKCGVKKIVFISSSAVYNKEASCPISEEAPTDPICAYGVQKITIEKLLHLYQHMYGLDYRAVRLANPYGPYQRPNGEVGVVTTFVYRALKGEKIVVYGDGSVIRDYIYIDDAVRAVYNIANKETGYRIFNVGCGYGTSIWQVLDTIQKTLGLKINVEYTKGRNIDIPASYLDISRYENIFGKLNPISLEQGIKNTAEFMRSLHEI